MKKGLKLFLFAIILIVGICFNTRAFAYTQDEAITRVKVAESKMKEVIDSLTLWSNKYANTVESLFTKDFFDKVDNVDFETNINLVIKELENNEYNNAALELANMKTTLVTNVDYMKESLKIIEEYLIENSSDGTIGSIDLFIQIRQTLKQLKAPVKNLFNIYTELDYSDIKAKIEEYDTVEELLDVYDEVLNKISTLDSVATNLKSKLSTWQGIYNEYQLSDYNDLFKEYFGDFYTTGKNNYNKLYNKLEAKLQNKLDEKIDAIVDETDVNDYASILSRNTKLYDIINYITKVKQELIDKFGKVNELLEIKELITKVNNQQKRIMTRIDEAVDYTEQYILEYELLTHKVTSDKKYITIDAESGLIIYNQYDLNAINFTNRLISTLGNINTLNIYGGNIGTLSKIQVQYKEVVIGDYTIVVKGDIAPNGAFDITDVVKLCNKMFELEQLDNYSLIAADLNNDSIIDITDVVMLCNILFR